MKRKVMSKISEYKKECMSFKMNGRSWIIKNVPQEKFWEYENEEREGNSVCYFGQTHFNSKEIWIDEGIANDLKIKTLYHELLHCYRGNYICNASLDNQDEDFWCDFIANSIEIINSIVEEYKKFLGG